MPSNKEFVFLHLRRAVSLLKRGSDPNELVDGIAAIHLAAGLQLPMGYFFTKLLIDHGADPNKKTIDGVTPVQLASMWNRSETLRSVFAETNQHYYYYTFRDRVFIYTVTHF